MSIQYIGNRPVVVPLDSLHHVTTKVVTQFSEIIDLFLTSKIDDFTITADTALNNKEIAITCATLPTTSMALCLKEGSSFYQGKIIAVSGTGPLYTVTTDSPLDFAFTTNATCSIETSRMNVNGSVTPIIFRVSPAGLTDIDNPTQGQRWDIMRMLVTINDSAAMDDGKFGSGAALTNGIVVRRVNGVTRNIFNAKTNGDLALRAYDTTYVPDTLGPSGKFGLRCRRSFNGPDKNGVSIRLHAADNDEFQVIIYDDLTGQDSFEIVVQGSIVEE